MLKKGCLQDENIIQCVIPNSQSSLLVNLSWWLFTLRVSANAVVGKIDSSDQTLGFALPSIQIYLALIDETIRTCMYM